MTASADRERFPIANATLKCVLFVEDSDDDYVVAWHELKKIKLCNPVRRVRTVEELFDYLDGMVEYHDGKIYLVPAAIILDMRLPGIDGLQVQAMLRTNMKYRNIPIIPISGPERMTVLKTALELGADAYLVKPINGVSFKYVASKISLPLQFSEA